MPLKLPLIKNLPARPFHKDRKFLVYCALKNGTCQAELFAKNRLFDVAINDYGKYPVRPPQAEWFFTEKTQKLYGAFLNLPKITQTYQYYALLDDDIRVSAVELDQLFLLGHKHSLSLYQPALTPESYCSWAHTRQLPGKGIRIVPFVEMMTPFFSRQALEACLPSFGENISGWGLDMLAWPSLLKKKVHIIDAIAVHHTRPIYLRPTKQANGLTPQDELNQMFLKYPPPSNVKFLTKNNISVTGHGSPR